VKKIKKSPDKGKEIREWILAICTIISTLTGVATLIYMVIKNL
jgi:hypothetical protein